MFTGVSVTTLQPTSTGRLNGLKGQVPGKGNGEGKAGSVELGGADSVEKVRQGAERAAREALVRPKDGQRFQYLLPW